MEIAATTGKQPEFFRNGPGQLPLPEDLDLDEHYDKDVDADEAAFAGFEIQDEDEVFGDLLSDDGMDL